MHPPLMVWTRDRIQRWMAQERAYYRFENKANVAASVYWMSHRTKRKLFCTLKPGHFVDINTFCGHCWIFEDANTGDCLLGNGSCIFTPTKWREYVLKANEANPGARLLARKVLKIRRPRLSLKGLSFNAIRDSGISLNEAKSLLLPETVKGELLHMVKKRECIARHTNACENCPFDLHKSHFYHICNMSVCLNLLKARPTGRLVRLPHGRLTCINVTAQT